MAALTQNLAAEPGWGLMWVLPSLAGQCPGTGWWFVPHREGDTWEATTAPGAVQEGEPFWAMSHSWKVDGLSCSCPLSPSQPKAANYKESFLSEMGSWALGGKENDSIPTLLSLSPPLSESWVSVVLVSASFSLAKEIMVTNSSSYMSNSVSGIRSSSWKQNYPSCLPSQLSRNIRKCSRKPGMYFNSDNY